MRTIIFALAAGLCGGCGTSRLQTRVAQLEQELAKARAAAQRTDPYRFSFPPAEEGSAEVAPPPMEGAVYGHPRVATVHVNTDPVAPALRRHKVHNWTEGLGVAVQEGAGFLPVDSATGIMVTLDGTSVLAPVVPPGVSEFEISLLGQPRLRNLTYLCIELQPDGTGVVVGRHHVAVPFGAGGYDTVDSYVKNWNCVGTK